MSESIMVRLADAGMTTADPTEDIRGRQVVDKDGEEVGKIDALLIDEDERRVRFLEIGSGGFLGIGEEKVLVPVDAVTHVDDDRVHIDRDRTQVAGGPDYDPELTYQRDYYSGVYGYYGFGPYWAPGYVYPRMPY